MKDFSSSTWINPICLSLVILCSLTGNAFSQQPSFKNLTVDDGLPSAIIYSVFQDKKGFLWFASDKGVARYDGYGFTYYTVSNGLADNEIFDFFEDSQGRIWFHSYNGKVSYYLNGIIYNSSNTPALEYLNASSYISSICEDERNHQIWISSYRDGIVNYPLEGSGRRFFSNNEFVEISKILVDTAGLIMLAKNGIFSVSFDSSYMQVDKVSNLNFRLSGNLNKVKVYRSSDDIFITNFTDTYQGNLSTQQYKVLYSDQDSAFVTNVGEDGDNVWIATMKGAIYYYRDKDQLSKKILEGHPIASILRDAEGNLWVATLGDGIFFQSKNAIYTFPEAKHVYCLARDPMGSVWLGYDAGMIGKIRGNAIKSLSLGNPVTKNRLEINSITFSNNNIWVCNSMGIFKLMSNGREYISGHSYYATESSTGILWCVYRHLLIPLNKELYDQNKYQIETLDKTSYIGLGVFLEVYKKYAFIDRPVNAVAAAVSASRMWASTDERVYLIDIDSNKIIRTIRIDPKIRVHGIQELSNGNLALATFGNGLEIISPDGKRLATVTTKQGLPSDFCTVIAADENDDIWIGTNKGVCKVTGIPDNISVVYLDKNDGLLYDQITDVLVNHDTVWVASKEGLQFLLKKSITIPASDRAVYIRTVSVNGHTQSLESGDIESMSLKYSENDIAISFVYLSYQSHGKILYRYKLLNDQSWRYTWDTGLNFTSLSAGDYKLQIEAKDKSGKWSQPGVFEFSIAKPFWKTWLFTLGIFGISTVLVWRITVSYFERRRKEMVQTNQLILSELKTLRAQINPHLFFNVLNAIQGMMFKNDPETTHSYLSKFGKLVRHMLDHSDKNYITLEEEIESLTNYLQLEQLRMKNRFNYRFEVDPALDIKNMEIPIMMLQPFVENSIKHGFQHKEKQGMITVSFEKRSYHLHIKIVDNGIGRRRSRQLRTSPHTSKGNDLIQRRIETLNFQRKRKIEITIEDLEDDMGNHPGTCVFIKIPME